MTRERAEFTRLQREPPKTMRVAALLIADRGAMDVVRGEVLLAHAVRGLVEAGCADRIIVVAPPGAEPVVGAVAVGHFEVLPAAGSRAGSARLAFEAARGCDAFLVHDAARAFVPAETIRAVAGAVREGAQAVVPVLPVTDTVKLVGPGEVITATEDRSRLRTIQAPLGCTRDVLREACARGVDPLASPPGTVRTVAGHPHAIRLTTAFDRTVAEALLREEHSARGRHAHENGSGEK